MIARAIAVKVLFFFVATGSAPPPVCASPPDDQAFLIRWPIQEVRRIAIKLVQRRLQPAHILTWSLWRRAHQADARRAHLKSKATVIPKFVDRESSLRGAKRRSNPGPRRKDWIASLHSQ